MPWGEFCTLLHGIGPDTALGRTVRIRSEDDKDMLKTFTPEQKQIRDAWRLKMMERQKETTSDEEKAEQAAKIQKLFEKAFGSNKK